MTLLIKIGRKIPKGWMQRQLATVRSLMTFQENLWWMIRRSMSLARRKAQESDTGVMFYITDEEENLADDPRFKLQWIIVTVQGTKEQELAEHADALKMYEPFGRVMKGSDEFSIASDFSERVAASKFLTGKQLDEVYEHGYKHVSDSNMANKLLEMGIITHIELLDDYDQAVPPPLT